MNGNATFVPFASFIDAAFWNEVNKKKLNEWKLDDSPKPLKGLYSINDAVGVEARLTFGHESFDSTTPGYDGELHVMNTLEQFKKMDKPSFLKQQGLKVYQAITDQSWLENPKLLTHFAFVLFADLKKYQYFYWCCTPAIVSFPANLTQQISDANVNLSELDNYQVETGSLVFVHTKSGCFPITSLRDDSVCSQDVQVVFIDPSPVDCTAGWPLRNLVAAVAVLKPSWQSANFVSLRGNGPLKQFRISWNSSSPPSEPSFTGWEPNAQGKLLPRFVDMRSQFDPKRLMEQAVGLNLSLIKWRLVPEMNLQRLENLRVLIMGAGTLGCNLARNLMAYNVKTISFIDNSFVSYSNPVRQSLSKFEDARLGRGKAETAASALREIYPSVDAHAYNITVPMPGHSVGANGEAQLCADVEKLEELVASHDVIFLALDSREARWLPTVIANKFGKMVYSVALGFDTFVVIRHGVTLTEEEESNHPTNQMDTPSNASVRQGMVVPYSQLACYFCSDVTAPGNSTTDRTLDQQCTVSRPGLSPIAAGVAVELLSSILQHVNPYGAPANIGEIDESSSLLGATPHQIRGFVFKFQQMTPCVRRFEKCIACGSDVAKAYESDGWLFVKEVMNSPSVLERVSGLDQLQQSVDDVQIDFSDNDSVMSL